MDVHGRVIITAPGDPAETFAEGLLALPSNMGTFTRRRFAMLPEIDVNLRYQVSTNLSLNVGGLIQF